MAQVIVEGSFVKEWAKFQTIYDKFEISQRALNSLVDDGVIRCRKMPGDDVRAGRLYCLGDVRAFLERGVEEVSCLESKSFSFDEVKTIVDDLFRCHPLLRRR